MTRAPIKIVVEQNDVLDTEGDVLALKHSQETFGVDEIVVNRLEAAGILTANQLPKPAGYHLVSTKGTIAASKILFVGTNPPRQFGYEEIRDFARLSLTNLAVEAPDTKVFLVTLHGAGFGLDETEAFESEIAGFVDAISSGDFPEELHTIKIVERNSGRAKRLGATLSDLLPQNTIPMSSSDSATQISNHSANVLRTVGYNSASKPFVFVAMSFDDTMDDVFHFGIRNPIKSAGFLCERADELSFTGDILGRVKNRIENSTFMVADLTGANPNVYLEVGFAWGLQRPTILLANESDELKFNVRGQRCLMYKSIRDLETKLAKEIKSLCS